MTAETLSSLQIVNLDATPPVIATAGEGGPGEWEVITSSVAHTTAFGSATKNTSQQARFSVDAKVKNVWMYTTGLDSSSSQTLTLDVNVAFSDSATDGTPVYLQSGIPGSALTGATTTLASYSSPNKMFGAALTVAASGAQQWEEITFLGTYTPAMREIPMWANLGGTGAATAAVNTAGGGFAQQGGSGQICSPGGFFNLLVVTAHTSTTNATGTIGFEVDYVI